MDKHLKIGYVIVIVLVCIVLLLWIGFGIYTATEVCSKQEDAMIEDIYMYNSDS